ncbi:MAG: hypothetical protein Q8N81_02495 [bacterium]|nr:hypothetical protein [bacterium]
MNFRKLLIILVSVLLLAAAADVILERQFLHIREQPSEQKLQPVSVFESYENGRFGYRLLYPSSWVLEAAQQDSDTVTFSNPNDFSEEITVSVVDAKMESVIKKSLQLQGESPIVLGGVPATIGFRQEQSDSRPFQAVYAVNGKYLYYLMGRSDRFAEVVDLFQFFGNSR